VRRAGACAQKVRPGSRGLIAFHGDAPAHFVRCRHGVPPLSSRPYSWRSRAAAAGKDAFQLQVALDRPGAGPILWTAPFPVSRAPAQFRRELPSALDAAAEETADGGDGWELVAPIRPGGDVGGGQAAATVAPTVLTVDVPSLHPQHGCVVRVGAWFSIVNRTATPVEVVLLADAADSPAPATVVVPALGTAALPLPAATTSRGAHRESAAAPAQFTVRPLVSDGGGAALPPSAALALLEGATGSDTRGARHWIEWPAAAGAGEGVASYAVAVDVRSSRSRIVMVVSAPATVVNALDHPLLVAAARDGGTTATVRIAPSERAPLPWPRAALERLLLGCPAHDAPATWTTPWPAAFASRLATSATAAAVVAPPCVGLASAGPEMWLVAALTETEGTLHREPYPLSSIMVTVRAAPAVRNQSREASVAVRFDGYGAARAVLVVVLGERLTMS